LVLTLITYESSAVSLQVVPLAGVCRKCHHINIACVIDSGNLFFPYLTMIYQLYKLYSVIGRMVNDQLESIVSKWCGVF